MATDINKLLLIVSQKWETKGKFYADACAITKFHSKAVAGVEEDTITVMLCCVLHNHHQCYC